MKCGCGKDAVIYQRYAPRAYCESCFIKLTDSRIRKNITKNDLIKARERIGIAFSGGKDSSLLIYQLYRLKQKIPLELVAISIDEGIKGYRKETLKIAKKRCKDYGIEQHIYRFKDLFGVTLDRIARKKGRACSYCGVLRRRALNTAAKELKVDKIATGHNLDDEIQAVVMNYMRGDAERLARLGVKNSPVYEGLVPKVKILRTIPEKECMLYCLLKKMEVSSERCPYAGYAMRNDIRNLIDDLEFKYPGTKFAILNGFDRILPALKREFGIKELGRCRICGEPSSGRICKVCECLKDF